MFGKYFIAEMSFVVVWLNEPKKHVVIEDGWVQGLNCAKLKNNGRNSNQDFLIFWASIDGIPNLGIEPRFDATLSSEFVSTTNGTCYYGRIEKFFGKYSIQYLCT